MNDLTQFERAMSASLTRKLGYKVWAYYEGFWIVEVANENPGIGASIDDAVKDLLSRRLMAKARP